MKKIILITINIFCILNVCTAQLNKLCPVSSIVYDKQKAAGMNLLLNTKDCSPYLVPNSKTTQTASVQLINALQPFPPMWFQMGNQEADTLGFFETTFLLDVRIQKNGGKLSFFNTYPGKFFGSVSFDTATLLPTDTLKTYLSAPVNNPFILDPHDYQTDAAGNKLVANHIQTKINISCLTGLQKDSARAAFINEILILSPDDSVIFKWNPLEHISACEMNWEYKDASISFGDVINWSHINSLRFANDGNIIYSFRHIGLGKINRVTGEIMWKLGGKDTLNAIPMPDTINYYLQHDFLQGEDNMYSVFSNGDNKHPYLDVLVFDINDTTKTAKLVNRYKPEPKIFSKAMGSYECIGKTCVICYGAYSVENSKVPHEIGRILVDNRTAVSLRANNLNFPYKIIQTKWAAIQRRPKVTQKNGVLQSNSLAGLHDYTWYKIKGTTAIPVGNGKTFTPTVSGKYVVEAQQGDGLFKSYLISDVINFTKKK